MVYIEYSALLTFGAFCMFVSPYLEKKDNDDSFLCMYVT